MSYAVWLGLLQKSLVLSDHAGCVLWSFGKSFLPSVKLFVSMRVCCHSSRVFVKCAQGVVRAHCVRVYVCHVPFVCIAYTLPPHTTLNPKVVFDKYHTCMGNYLQTKTSIAGLVSHAAWRHLLFIFNPKCMYSINLL